MPYTEQFFSARAAGSRQSAEAILPIVLEMISPESVIDVGCGTGNWTRVLEAHVSHVVAVDGSWVPATSRGPGFQPRNLEEQLGFDQQFDLAICLEVAEHLSPDRAKSFVADLVGLAPVILFSAAIPKQGGEEHLNEQWQSYWATLFLQHGYHPQDVVRPRVWDLPDVDPWYAQNTLLYSQSPSDAPALLDVVHPKLYTVALEARMLRPSPRSWLRRALGR